MNISNLPLGGMWANCWLLESNGQAAVIDPGAENSILRRFAEACTLDIKYIVLTHGHFDHIGGAGYLKDRFSEAKVAVGKEDAPKLLSTALSLGDRFGVTHPAVTADIELCEGDVLTIGDISLKVLQTPGHTKGGITLAGEGFAFTGDTLFAGSIGRCDFPDSDIYEMKQSLYKLSQLPDGTVIYTGHGGESTIGSEKKFNPYLREEI